MIVFVKEAQFLASKRSFTITQLPSSLYLLYVYKVVQTQDLKLHLKVILFILTGAQWTDAFHPFSLYTSQVTHQAGAYRGFRSMKRLAVFVLPP